MGHLANSTLASMSRRDKPMLEGLKGSGKPSMEMENRFYS